MGSTEADPDGERAIAELAAILGDLADEMVLIGGMAFNFWRGPRYTHDIDFDVHADTLLLKAVGDRLTAAGYVRTLNQGVDAPSGPDFVQFTDAQHTPPRVVEFQAAKTEFQELTISRGRRFSADQPFAVATPEDLIVLKLIANRSQDISDCVQLAQLPDLDWAYIDHWCAAWDIAARAAGLRRAMEEERRRVEDLDP